MRNGKRFQLEPHLDEMAISSNRAIERLPLTVTTPIGLVHGPAVPHWALPALAEALQQDGGQLPLPGSYRFMREDAAALEEHLRHITETQLVTIAPEDDQTHDICRIFEIVQLRIQMRPC
jgi:hypothetical protein